MHLRFWICIFQHFYIINSIQGCLMTNCLNGGSCLPDKENQTFSCSRQQPWTGDRCEVKKGNSEFYLIYYIQPIGGGLIGSRIDGFGLKKRWWIFAINQADSRFENTADGGSAVNFGAESGLCLSTWVNVRILGKRNLNHRSFFSHFIEIISFFERNSFKLKCGTVIGIVLCYSRQECCLLYYFCKINYGIHIYQFTFELLHLCSRMWAWFRVWTKILVDGLIWQKRHGSAHLHKTLRYL